MDSFSKRMGAVVTAVVYVLLAAGLAAYIGIPWIAKALLFYFQVYVPTLIAMYVGGAAGFWLLVEFLLIMRSVKAGTPFIDRNVRSLKHIAICCAIAAAAVIWIFCFRPAVGIGLCAVILIFGMLCAIVLASVFKQAVAYKQDQDLTI